MNDNKDNNKDNLKEKRCKPCEGGVPALTRDQIQQYLKALPEWKLQALEASGPSEGQKAHHIFRIFEFKNYYKTMAFVNALAWIAHQENHHPDLLVGYNYCRVQYSTHAIGGLSENDFICAAKVDALLQS